MKTLLLSTEDIQNFSKLIGDPNAAVQLSSTSGQTAGCNLMALQYYLKHPGNYPAATAQTQLSQGTVVATQATTTTQPQTQKHLLLKQPTVPHTSYHHHHQHHHQHQHHHHPYYQQHTSAGGVSASGAHARTQNHSAGGNSKSTATLPVHALNQNSNFSAASSSTGGGTISSHAPTQQSNTTNSSLSPPSSTIVAVAAAAKANNAASAAPARSASAAAAAKTAATARAAGATTGGSATSATKKVKTEPSLTQFQQNERLTFANAHIVWSEEHWKRVVFHDERKFNLDGPDGFSYYFHDLRNHERTLSQRPRGNSVFIYIVITAGGPVHLEISTGKLKPESYVETILRERPNIVNKLGGNPEFVLQDHNWIANTLPTVQEWLAAEGVKTQRWPTIAHDLNIMENIWGWLIREVYDGGRKFSRKDDLIFRIREAWARLPMDLVNNLYSTLPERTMELYYTRGIYTNC